VSDPDHPRYGQHLTIDEVNELARPNKNALTSVHQWLSSYGYTKDKLKHNAAKDWIKLSIPVKDAEALLDTKYSVFRHEDGTEVIRTPKWSLPKDLHQHIVAIQPTNSFMRPIAKRFRPITFAMDDAEMAAVTEFNIKAASLLSDGSPSVADVCNARAITTSCLRTLYKTIGYTPQLLDDPRNVLAFTNYLNETSMNSDLRKFLTLPGNRPDIKEAAAASIPVTIINNAQNNQVLTGGMAGLNGEGNLDGQTTYGIVYPMKVRMYNTGGSPPLVPGTVEGKNENEPYVEWLDYMLTQEKNVPYVISTSYGDDEFTVPPDYAQKVCQNMAQLGALGATILFASGDNGVAPAGGNKCVSHDGKNTPAFVPSFPASCPYVTVVGATKGFNPEVAAYDPPGFSSGAGFSNYFAMPDWQKNTVSGYVKTLAGKFQGLYNASGRAYPDIAAQGQKYAIQVNGTGVTVDGTSASTPTAASILALLTDYKLSQNKTSGPLGWINPWLYKEGYKAFNDITSGSARGCKIPGNNDGLGFPAAPGWDAVTGFGTPVRKSDHFIHTFFSLT
jgi:tripeptidyl-peptidase I